MRDISHSGGAEAVRTSDSVLLPTFFTRLLGRIVVEGLVKSELCFRDVLANYFDHLGFLSRRENNK